jgi:hypothetical protein
MRRPHLPALLCGLVALVIAGSVSLSGAGASPAPRATDSTACRALPTPASLGATVLSLHRNYMRHREDVHKPKITGPVAGSVHVGECGGELYAIADFDAAYNGFYFGVQDQPERFVKPAGSSWRDIGDTGGHPCGSAPTALLKDWKIVKTCTGPDRD